MIWPFSKFAKWAKEKAVKDAMTPEQKLALAQQRVSIVNAAQAEKTVTTMKIIVFVCLANGIAWVWCSYILAFLGQDAIAESLSQVALAEIIGVVVTYALKSILENLSKHNHWPDKGVDIVEGIEYTNDGDGVGYDENNEEDFVG